MNKHFYTFPKWQRYLFKEIVKVFLFFLGALFLLYLLLDYSTHVQDFIQDERIALSRFCLYYAYQFIKRCDLLIPLALLVATIKVLFTLNLRHELLALQAAGLSLKKILRPLFLLALLCSLFNYGATEWVLPKALSFIDSFHNTHFKHSYKGKRKERVHVISLKDHSKLVYQSYDSSKEMFFDLFWVRSAEEIWRIQSLNSNLLGSYVDKLERNKEGFFEKKQSFSSYNFQQMKWDLNSAAQGKIPIENMSFSQLYRLYFKKSSTTSYQKPEILTQLTFKSLLPLLSFLVLIGASPWCVRYSRTSSPFFTYALSLFAFLSLYVLLDSATILGANQTLSPFFVIFTPFTLCSMGFLWKFSKI